MPIDWRPSQLIPAEREVAGAFSFKKKTKTTHSVGSTIQPEYHEKRKVVT